MSKSELSAIMGQTAINKESYDNLDDDDKIRGNLSTRRRCGNDLPHPPLKRSTRSAASRLKMPSAGLAASGFVDLAANEQADEMKLLEPFLKKNSLQLINVPGDGFFQVSAILISAKILLPRQKDFKKHVLSHIHRIAEFYFEESAVATNPIEIFIRGGWPTFLAPPNIFFMKWSTVEETDNVLGRAYWGNTETIGIISLYLGRDICSVQHNGASVHGNLFSFDNGTLTQRNIYDPMNHEFADDTIFIWMNNDGVHFEALLGGFKK